MDIEGIVIGHLLFYGRLAMHIAKDIVTHKDFDLNVYGEAFNCMLDLYKEGKNWDLPTIAIQFVNEHKMTATVLCRTYKETFSCMELFPGHVKKLKKRNLEAELQTAMNNRQSPKEIKEKILALENLDTQSIEAVSIKDAITDALEEYERTCTEPIEFSTGFRNIDHRLGGLHRSDLVVIGGCTGHGKTNLSLNIALNIIKNKNKVLFINGEMSTNQLILRLLCMSGDCNSAKIRNKAMDGEEWQKVARSASKLKDYALHFYCKSAPTTALIANLINKHSPDVIVVDFIQLMADTMGKENRALHLANLARGLKNIALEQNICVIALSQLNREAARRDGKPKLSDLRESGGIEESADLVLLIYTTEQEETNVYVAKNRHGESGMNIDLLFDRTTLKMEEI
jgi:replicative DNA helicase